MGSKRFRNPEKREIKKNGNRMQFRIGINPETKQVQLHFGVLVKGISMTPEDARRIGNTLVKMADDLEHPGLSPELMNPEWADDSTKKEEVTNG